MSSQDRQISNTFFEIGCQSSCEYYKAKVCQVAMTGYLYLSPFSHKHKTPETSQLHPGIFKLPVPTSFPASPSLQEDRYAEV